jgi:hypothetical protein
VPEPKLHLLKLCVGVENVSELAEWQDGAPERNRAQGLEPNIWHVTRMWPRRAEELLAGGSLYWVVKGQVQVRQRILALDERMGHDGIRRCAIRLDPQLYRTVPQPRRPFQGWRYLAPKDAPSDLGPYTSGEEDIPDEMRIALAELGVL